ncbi:MAG TPA: MFS transporter [Terracidiphilus sp.]|jgi:MFS transporter, FHS family, glucose/mannose:H+ symporter
MKLRRSSLPVLHVAFGLTGVLHAIGGALLPALAASFGLSDSRSGALFLCYFLGTPLGAIFCVGRYARLIMIGCCVAAAACCGIAFGGSEILPLLFLVLGVGVGLCMSAVSMYAGRAFVGRTAAPLTLLNFTWSAGALIAPLLAARVLVGHSWRTAYELLAILAALAAAMCWIGLEEPPVEQVVAASVSSKQHWVVIAVFAFLAFLNVGIENTTATWLASYAMRTASTGAARAAASSSLYWCGFLTFRGLWALLLNRMNPTRVLMGTVMAALLAAGLLVGFAGAAPVAMLLLGAALAPVFPLLLSLFFARARVSDSRWVLAMCGFGGSVLPWLTGYVSSRAGSLRVGLFTVPVALAVMICLLPWATGRELRD